MADREKVIKGLECCTTAIGCSECPYAVGEKATNSCNLLIDRDALTLLKAQEPEALDVSKSDSDIGCWYDITHNYTLEQVVSAIKAQEPRVMTLEEVLATEVVYAEDVDKADIIPVLVDRRVHDRIVLVRARLMGGPSLTIYPLISDYGKYWRCWTSRPTAEQREAVPWE